MPSLDHRLNSWSRSKNPRAIHIIYPFTRGMSYCSSMNLPPLTPGVTNFQGHFFKTSVTHLPSITYFPLLVIHLSGPGSVRTATRFTRPISRTKHIVPLLITPEIITGYHPVTTSRFNLSLLVVGFLFFFLFSSPNLSRRRLDVYRTSTHGVALLQT